MQEVGGKKLDDGVARDDVRSQGRISILELEIYNRVSDGSGLLLSKAMNK